MIKKELTNHEIFQPVIAKKKPSFYEEKTQKISTFRVNEIFIGQLW